MKSHELLKEIGCIEDELIVEAENYKRKSFTPLKSVCTIAACAVIAVGCVLVYHGSNGDNPLPELPKLTVEFDNGAMGFEGFMVHDIDELYSINLLDDNSDYSTLPVYKNTSTDFKPTIEEMTATSERIAVKMNLDINEIRITPTDEELADYERQIRDKLGYGGTEYSEDDVAVNMPNQYVIADCGSIQIEIEKYVARVKFTEGYTLPEQELFAATNSVIEKFGSILDMKEPVAILDGGDYTIYGERLVSAYIVDNDVSVPETKSLYRAYCSIDNGELSSITWWYDYSAMRTKFGDYPIITAEEAQAMIIDGQYLTTVPEEFSGEEYIARVELMYRNGLWEKTYMPYYRFLVELTQMPESENGLKHYGAYYVPAVRSEYLENMPMWSGGLYG